MDISAWVLVRELANVLVIFYVVTAGDKNEELRVRHGRSLYVGVDFRPVITASLPSKVSSSGKNGSVNFQSVFFLLLLDAFVTDYLKGTVTHLQCYSVVSLSCKFDE